MISGTVEHRDERLTYPVLMSVALLRACMGGDQTGFLEVRRLPSGRQQFFDLSDPDGLYDAADVGAAIEDEDVYFGISPRVRESGSNDDVERCHVLFADLDGDDALDALDARRRDGLPEPSFVVSSGGLAGSGRQKLHAYWALSTPVDPEAARVAKQRLAAALVSDPAVHDPARIARLPLTRYHKDGSQRQVRVLKGSVNRRYALEDVVGKLPERTAPSPSMNGHVVNQTTADGRPELFELFGRALKRAGESRNGACFDLACALRDHGYTADEARDSGEDVVLAINALKPTNASGAHEPYTSREWGLTVKSAFSKPPRALRETASTTGVVERRVVTKRASEIRTELVTWAWQDRVPLGAITILAGQPGLGKSTLTLRLAAEATAGDLNGDLKGKPCAVLIVTLEDHLASVAKPRLLAAKANLDLVHFVTVEVSDGEDLVTLPDDIAALERQAIELEAKVIVVDPIVATLNGKLDSHRDQDVRRALAPIAKLAERCDLAVVGVMHLNKSQSTTLINRVSGSIAWAGAARSILVFDRDPDDPSGEDGDRRVLAHAKCNVGAFAPTLACRIEPRTGRDERDSPFRTSTIVIVGNSSVTASDLAGSRGGDDRSSHDDAVSFLSSELAEGPRSARVLRSAAADAGIGWRTIERAKKTLDVVSVKNGAAWEWRLNEDRQPLGGLDVGGLGGLPESPVNPGDLPTHEVEDRQTKLLAVLTAKPDVSPFVREPREAI